jgi:rhodanese-related sulfurtransferase
MKIAKLTVVVLLIGLFALVPACKKQESSVGEPAKLTIEQLDTLLKSNTPPALFDANNDETRKESGVIPGAKLLSSSSDYDVASTLPGDRASKLVFYCGGIKCRAAEGAAKKALLAGYQDVNVLPDGIKGWKSAGKSTSVVN